MVDSFRPGEQVKADSFRPGEQVDSNSRYTCRMTAGILAGGKSSRMGENKGLLAWKEQTLMEHLAKCLASEPCFDQLLVSVASAAEYQEISRRWQGEPELVFTEDIRRGYGPLEGLYQLLTHGKHPWLFVAAVDMPLISSEFIRRVIEEPRDEVQAVIPRAGGRRHPLCGLYARSALPVLERLLCREEHKVGCFLQELSVKYVDIEQLGVDASVLENVNTPEQYQKLKPERENI